MVPLVNSRRRWFGVCFLLVAGGLLVWGFTWLRGSLTGLGFLAYWLVCLLFTLLALFTALLDVRATRRQIRNEQRQLLERTVEDLQDDARRKRR